MELTHFDKRGNARMVDVADKPETWRRASARGSISMTEAAYEAVTSRRIAKGDVLTVATTAGIMAAKKTWELIPMCHLLPLAGLSIEWELDEASCRITCICTAKSDGRTGVEMEALTGVSMALLTVYDMCKAIDKFMEIGEIYLLEKEGGRSGHVIHDRK